MSRRNRCCGPLVGTQFTEIPPDAPRHRSWSRKAFIVRLEGDYPQLTNEDAYPAPVFSSLLARDVRRIKASLPEAVKSTMFPKWDCCCEDLFFEFQSCSQVLPCIDSLCSLIRDGNFERIFLVSHQVCSPGACLLVRIIELIQTLPQSALVHLTVWGPHMNQHLSLTFTATYACSYVEMGSAEHALINDLSLLEALDGLHFKIYPQCTSICHFDLCYPKLVSLNFTDCKVLPHAIHRWLLSATVKAVKLQSLVLSDNGIDDIRASEIINALRLNHNHVLQVLDLSVNNIRAEGITCLSAALATNTALRKLSVGGNPIRGQEYGDLIKVLCKTNVRIERLLLDGPDGDMCLQSFCDLIMTSKTLKALTIWDASCLQTSGVVAIFNALKINKCLVCFSLRECMAVDGLEVYGAILEALFVNHCLESLDLDGTPIMNNPKWNLDVTGLVQQRTVKNVASMLRYLTKVQPTTSRVFICGNGSAGKTSLCKMMTRVFKSGQEGYLKNISECLKTSLFVQPQTVGIEVTHIEYDKTSISLWDFSGQREYHAFHDIVFPHEPGPALFLVVCKLSTEDMKLRSPIDIKKELGYWLRYISSNTKKVENWIPTVVLVFSHKDKLASNQGVDDSVKELAIELTKEFEGFTTVFNDTFIVNCLSEEDVRRVAEVTGALCQKLLILSPPVLAFCNAMRCLIDAWNMEHPAQPWLETEDFLKLLNRESEEFLHTSADPSTKQYTLELADAVFHSLHDSGLVIFFKEIGLVFLNPGWFCEKFMGCLIDQTTKFLNSIECLKEGDAWRRKDVEKILEQTWESLRGDSSEVSQRTRKDLKVSHLIEMLLKMGFCYELHPGDPNSSLFIPMALQHCSHRGMLEWNSNMPNPLIYVGRRLKCEDEQHTLMTPGFFPAVQVYLRKHFSFPAVYSVKKNVISIHVDRMEILVEFCEGHTTFIDVLVRSCRSSYQTIKFVKEHVIQNILKLQSSSGHWQGIKMKEAVVRPICVKNLTPCARRLDQFVLVADLRKVLLNSPAIDIENATFPWPASFDLNLVVEHIFIKELLGDDKFSQVLSKVFTQVNLVSRDLDLPSPPPSSTERVPNSRWTYSLPELNNPREKVAYYMSSEMRSMIHDIKVDVQDIKNAVGGLVTQCETLGSQVREQLNKLLEKTKDSKFPRLFLLMKKKRLLTRFFPGVGNLNLQFMCEHEGSFHVPSNQPGYDISVIENDSLAKILPYLKYILSVIVLGLRVGARVVGGVSELVPDLSTAMDHLIQASGLAIDAALTSTSPDQILQSLESGKPGNTDDQLQVKFLIASAWVEECLCNNGCEKPFQIYKRFGLLKARMADGRTLWLCEEHINGLEVDWLK